MINSIPPGLVMFLGAFLVPLFPHIYRQFYMIFLVLLSAISLFSAAGSHLIIQVQDIQFLLHHSDNLSFPFAIVFHIAAFLVIIYGGHIKKIAKKTRNEQQKSIPILIPIPPTPNTRRMW